MRKPVILLIGLLAAHGHTKVVTVGSGKQFPSVNFAVRSTVPLNEDLYVLVEMPTGIWGGTDGLDPSIIGGFNGYQVIIRGFKRIPQAVAYIEDEATDEWNGTGFVETSANILGAGGIEGRTDFQNTTFFARDHLGSTRFAVKAETQTPQEMSAYQSFGSVRPIMSSSVPVRQKFVGKELDGETGLEYFGARFYSSDLGKWISPDPSKQFLDGYAYAGNGTNPVIGLDPNGHKLVMDKNASATFKTEFATAITYLNKGKVASVIANLEARAEVITVKEGPLPGGSGSDYFDPSTNELFWNPTSALDDKGSKQSPALGLLHEASHALQFLANNAQFVKDVLNKLPGYDNAEEQRVIDKVETPAAKKLGEGTRTSHGGKEYSVSHADQR